MNKTIEQWIYSFISHLLQHYIIYFFILYNNLFTIKLHYQNPVDTSFVFIRWSNLYIFQTSIASISSSFVDEGVVLWFNSKCISRLTLSFVLQSQSGHQYAYGLLNLLDVFPAIVDNKLSRCWLDLRFIHFHTKQIIFKNIVYKKSLTPVCAYTRLDDSSREQRNMIQ